ncbi:C6 transcription factor [Pseudozyma hubeiensis]|nr:C6 transcription factor [Pseudozyma hubeiensis]
MQKIKCNGDLGGCAHCEQTEQQCRYEPVSDDDKLRARSYKRKLIQRRQQTRVYFGGPTYLEPAFLADPYSMTRGTAGCCAPRSAVETSPAHMQQLRPALHPAIPQIHDTDSYAFFTSSSSESSTQLQLFSSSSSFPHTIPASCPLESLLSSSPSPSSSASSVMTPVGAPDHMHLTNFVGGLQACTMACMDTIACANDIAGPSASFLESPPSAPSPEYSTLSFQCMMAEFQIAASHYKPIVDANTSTLAGAFA